VGEICAALLIVQKVRYEPSEKPIYGPAPKRPRDVLRKWSELVRDTFAEVGVEEPTRENVKIALEQHRMFTNIELNELLDEI
jgi:hypothetical protein